MAYCSHCKTLYLDGERFCPVDGGPILEEDATPDKDPLIGRKVAHRYFIKRQIGKGGMGAVYEAEHVGLDKRVALKFILEKYTEDKEVLARFHREARTASKIGHDNIVNITDIGETEDARHFIVMEYLEGRDLSEELKSGALEPERALRIIAQVLSGLGAAHAKGIVHRDMKPENVFLTRRSDSTSDFAKIMDFGISKFITAHDSKVRLTQTGAVIGTPIYMAPEQAKAAEDIDHRADIYAVGVMLFEMLAGRPPFTAGSYLALVTQHLHDDAPRITSVKPGIAEHVEHAIAIALSKQPEERHDSCEAFASALFNATGTGPRAPLPLPGSAAAHKDSARFADTVHRPSAELSGQRVATPSSTTSNERPRRRSGRAFPVAFALLAAALGTGGYFLATRGASHEQASPPTALESTAPPTPTPTTEVPSQVVLDAGGDPEPDPQVGELDLTSQPSEASVYIDGIDHGKTPLRLDLPVGEYELRLEHAGYEPITQRKKVRAGFREGFHGAMAKQGSGKSSRVTHSGGRKKPPADKPTPGDPAASEPNRARPPDKTGPGTKPNPYIR